jgi:hypothetical protein
MINKRRNHTQTLSKPLSKNNTQQSSTFSNIKDTIISGFGLGVGNEIAHRAVSSIMGSRTVEIQHSQTNSTNSSNSCQEQMKMYEKCLKKSTQNNCLDELEVYQQCVKSI